MDIINKLINDRFTQFYTHGSSIAHTNKYIVCFYGPKVTAAINILQNSKSGLEHETIRNLLRYGIKPDGGTNHHFVELMWECSEVTIPTGDLVVDKSSHFFDYEKAIKHSYILGIQETGELKLKIIDTKEMIWYQFFNAMKNSFFVPEFFRPVCSSFNKVSCYIQVLQGTGTTGDTSNAADMNGDGTFTGQLFEFNSIVPVKFDAINLKHNADEPFSFHITFNAPNVFQGTYNSSFAGMRSMATYATKNGTNMTKNADGSLDLKTFYRTKLETDPSYITTNYKANTKYGYDTVIGHEFTSNKIPSPKKPKP